MRFPLVSAQRRGTAAARDRDGNPAQDPRLPRVTRRRGKRVRRTGSVAVEFAIVAIPLFTFVFAGIEFGRAMLALQTMEEAARTGGRVAILQGASQQKIEDAVKEVLQPAGISTYTIEVTPQNYASLSRWTPITVAISANYSDMSWLPAPRYLSGVTLSASSTFPKECSPDE